MPGTPTTLGFLIAALAVLSILLTLLHFRHGSPFVGICNRWLRWILFSLAIAYLVQAGGWSGRPFWAVATMAFLLWFLLETIYTWIMIFLLSRSQMPLFPRFEENRNGDEWPANPQLLPIRDWLRKHGFRRNQSLKARLFEDMTLRSTVYDSPDRSHRLQILFLPRRGTGFVTSFIFTTELKSGERIITDNVFVPFGGYYPADWKLVRQPLNRDIAALWELHRGRVDNEAQAVNSWDEMLPPLEDINESQRILEKVNTENGFLFPRYQHEEFGKITQSGRYRVWKEVWLLNYFGRTLAPHQS